VSSSIRRSERPQRPPMDPRRDPPWVVDDLPPGEAEDPPAGGREQGVALAVPLEVGLTLPVVLPRLGLEHDAAQRVGQVGVEHEPADLDPVLRNDIEPGPDRHGPESGLERVGGATVGVRRHLADLCAAGAREGSCRALPPQRRYGVVAECRVCDREGVREREVGRAHQHRLQLVGGPAVEVLALQVQPANLHVGALGQVAAAADRQLRPSRRQPDLPTPVRGRAQMREEGVELVRDAEPVLDDR
jgi:hypothetical protein